MASTAPGRLHAWRSRWFGERDQVAKQLDDTSKQGTGMARLAHGCASLMLFLFSAGSLVALGGDALGSVTAGIQAGHVVIPAAISLGVSTLLVLCMDVAMLYAGLADGGLARPLVWSDGAAPPDVGVRLVRAEAANQVIDILRESPPPKGRAPPALLEQGAKLAFKTGTSYGFRDALAIGVGGGYVVAVWTGRPDGGARGGLTGREAALPLLFDAFDVLRPGTSAPRPIAPRTAPLGLTHLGGEEAGPHIIFPPDGASVEIDAPGPRGRGLALAARGEVLHWYVDGKPVGTGESLVWHPPSLGFFRLMVVDAEGRRAKARVQIRAR